MQGHGMPRPCAGTNGDYNDGVNFRVDAITLDLDDTLWPFAPIGARIERTLHDWFLARSPATATRFPIEAMRELRERIHAEFPQHEHDLGLLRRLTIERALAESGGDPMLAAEAHALFLDERNRVDFHPEVPAALQELAALRPLAALSNGNADLERIGIDHLFRFRLGAKEFGRAKPDAAIFLAACERLGAEPAHVLHVGDHPEQDALGAQRAGLRCAWINREGEPWPFGDAKPDLEFADLAALAAWLRAHDLDTTRSAA
jgi:putative hydrolase of the HAD superfamily